MKKAPVVAAISAIMFCAVYLQCKNGKPADPRGGLYSGSAACSKCHSKIYDSYLHTAHYVATVPATVNTVHGSFEKNLNVFVLSPSQKVVMEKRDSELFQTYYLNGKAVESQRAALRARGIFRNRCRTLNCFFQIVRRPSIVVIYLGYRQYNRRGTTYNATQSGG